MLCLFDKTDNRIITLIKQKGADQRGNVIIWREFGLIEFKRNAFYETESDRLLYKQDNFEEM